MGFLFTENSPCPETQNEVVSSSNRVEVMAYALWPTGLDYSGSQPFNCSVSYTNSTDTSVTGSQVGDNR